MSTINQTLKEKINEYENQIEELEKKVQYGTEEEKRKHDFELADLKSKLSVAQQELKNTWGEGKDNIAERIADSQDELP